MKYTVCMHYDSLYFSGRPERQVCKTGTLSELVDYFRYTLETGKSWEHERRTKKINLNPKTIGSLVVNVNNAMSNATRNGYPGKWLEYIGKETSI